MARSGTGATAAGLLLLLILVGGRPAEAKSPVPDLIARAKATKDVAEAGRLFGQAVAAAQKVRDLEDEQAAAEALDAWMDGIEPDVGPSPDQVTHAQRPQARIALASVLSALDPKRHGAFVSAHAIAAELLGDAVAVGDGGHVAAAAAVLLAHASTPKAGRAAAAMAKWGEGMLALKQNDLARADAALEEAAKASAAAGWLAPAAYAATELAALRWKAKEAGMASAALGLAVRLVEEDSDKVVVQEWIRAVRARLPDLPEAALAEFKRATDRFDHAASDGTRGAGGDGGADAEPTPSPLGRHLAKASADKPFASVTRAKEGFEMRLAFDSEGKPNRPFTWGQDHWQQGGVTLAFAGRAVALRILDPTGKRGEPGQRHRASRVRAFYLLAEGETWGVAKNGSVTVTGS